MPALVELAGDLSSEHSGVAFRDAIPADRSARGRLFHAGPSSNEPGQAVRVLLVGCGPELRAQLQQRLLQPQWSIHDASGGAEAIELLGRHGSDLVILAPWLHDLDVSECSQFIQSRFPSVQVISLDGPQPKAGQARLALGELLGQQARFSGAGNVGATQSATSALRTNGWCGLLGGSEAMQKIFRLAQLVSRRDTTVLIQGESGTGKDLLARAIHRSGARDKQPFVVINCAAIPETLLEAELFGYTKGSFTGASQAKLGRVHAAHGGTLFLDEIGDMPLSLQSKILRFLEQGEVQRIGGTDTLKVDCRIIAATNADLKAQVKDRTFREDLYYRLAVVPLVLPALRERMDDLRSLCEQLLERFCPGSYLSTLR